MNDRLVDTAYEHYQAEFTRVQAQLPGRGLDWLQRARADALVHFAARGFPTLREEDWKYTRVAQIENGRFTLAPPVGLGISLKQVDALAVPSRYRLVFVDGRYQPALSLTEGLPPGVTLASLATLLEQEPDALPPWLTRPLAPTASAFAALNLAFLLDGAYVRLASGCELDAPLLLLYLGTSDGQMTAQRNLIVAEPGSRAILIEQHGTLNDAASFTNSVTDILLAPGAALVHHKLQQEGRHGLHLAEITVEQQADSRYQSSSIALGARLARTELHVNLASAGAACTLDGLYLADGRQHIDHHLRVDHAAPQGSSRIFYKGIVTDAARAVFNGKVIVQPDAQQSDANQINRNLLLSEQAEIDTKPQLEIFTDDVKCSHGATVGQLDPAQLFYLRARGVDQRAAEALLTFAFANEVVSRLEPAPLREHVEHGLRTRLPQAGEITV